jgi:hypothetical protein
VSSKLPSRQLSAATGGLRFRQPASDGLISASSHAADTLRKSRAKTIDVHSISTTRLVALECWSGSAIFAWCTQTEKVSVCSVKLRAIVLLSGFMFSARKLEKEPFRLCGFVADTLATRHGRMMVVRRYISIVPKWLELWRSRYWSCSVGLYGG